MTDKTHKSKFRKFLSSYKPLRAMRAAVWRVFLVLTLIVVSFGIFRHSGGDSVLVEGEIDSSDTLDWRVNIPRIGKNTVDGSKLKAVRMEAQDLYIDGWRGASLLLDIFAKAPLATASQEFESEGVEIKAAERMNLRVSFYPWYSRRRLTIAPDWLILVAYRFDDEPSVREMSDSYYGYGHLGGVDSSRFTLESDSDDCGNRCVQQFAEFKGVELLSDPPKYQGIGADGITRITIQSKTNRHDPELNHTFWGFKNTRGLMIRAANAKDVHIDDYASEVFLHLSNGRLDYDNRQTQIVEHLPVSIEFDETNLGSIAIASGTTATIKVRGIAHRVFVGDENLTPRAIEKWHWYVQMIIGILIAFFAERSYGEHQRSHN
jgi:hypothetical protein